MDKIVKIFSSPYELASAFAERMIHMITDSAMNESPFTIALSGGSTPAILFALLADKSAGSVPWQLVRIFWGDERCVPSDDEQSNYGMAMKYLFSKIEIPSSNIHRIIGEADPEAEAGRYSEEILKNTRKRDGRPLFDLIILGLGEDGHTASIFPGHTGLFDSDKICEVAVHPVTLQKRITLTGRVLNNADEITFLVTGRNKAAVVEKMFKKSATALNYPASHVVPVYGRLNWYLDQEAAHLL